MVNKLFLTAFIVVILDQISKFIFKDYFNYVTNTGAAFGLFKGQQLLFILVSLFVIILIIKYRKKYGPYALGLILGGTIGNLVDRLFLGYVIDFIDLKFWPVFNLADTATTIGLIWLIWKYRKD